jgi:erythromycin esterase-like protein
LITRRLIVECGFTVVAVEADWPDADRVNRFVMGQSDDPDGRAALSDFERFPAWMWRNTEVVEFVEWMRGWNSMRTAPAHRALLRADLYSLRASIEAVIRYLDEVDPEEGRRARERYACFDHVGADGQAYGFGWPTRDHSLRERGRRPVARAAGTFGAVPSAGRVAGC